MPVDWTSGVFSQTVSEVPLLSPFGLAENGVSDIAVFLFSVRDSEVEECAGVGFSEEQSKSTSCGPKFRSCLLEESESDCSVGMKKMLRHLTFLYFSVSGYLPFAVFIIWHDCHL